MAKQNHNDDIEFILTECHRFYALVQKDIKSIPREDALHEIPHPSGNGFLICGRAASQRINKLAQEAGRRAGILQRVEPEALRKPLKHLITRRFIVEKRPTETKQVDRILAATARAALKKCSNKTYFIPCHLMTAQTPATLRVGPILFLNRKSFRQIALEKITDYVEIGDPDRRELRRHLLTNAIRYYRSFDWVAQVEILGCDDETSKVIANRAVTSALDCLHLLIGAKWTDQMRVGGPAMRRDRRGRLTLSFGKLDVSISSKGVGQVNFGDGWHEILKRPEYQNLLNLMGIALEVAIDPDLNRPLSRRFLDAAQWFGEASRDESPSTRVVKYVTALERMVMTEEKDDITRLVTERVAAFCFDGKTATETAVDRDIWREKARIAYMLRSKLVHGSMSPHAPEVWQGVRLGAELCETTLLRALHHFGEAGLKMNEVSTKRLGRWFDDVIQWADNVTA